jgi:ATP-dependent Clp protease ATP-binding subunit ClpX
VAAIPPKGGRKHPEQNLININTKNILFICGGAFDGLEKIVAQRIGTNAMGFGAEIALKHSLGISELLEQLIPLDLLRFGLIPELVGRLPIVATLTELGDDALLSILKEPKNALVKQYQRLLEMDGVILEFEEEALVAVVKKANVRKTGARALRAVMEEFMRNIMYHIPSLSGISKCVITEETVMTNGNPIYEYNQLKKPA